MSLAGLNMYREYKADPKRAAEFCSAILRFTRLKRSAGDITTPRDAQVRTLEKDADLENRGLLSEE